MGFASTDLVCILPVTNGRTVRLRYCVTTYLCTGQDSPRLWDGSIYPEKVITHQAGRWVGHICNRGREIREEIFKNHYARDITVN